ncbi:MAG: hypothetical protein RLZ98_1900 [Pseudomonadota bacterium]|jgi:MFS family permease
MAGDRWELLRHRDFALICFTRLFNTFAFLIMQVAVGWYVYAVTNDAFALGWLGLASFLPSLLLVLVTGYVADRLDRRLVISISNTVMSAAALVLVAIVIWGYGLVWPVYAVVIVISAARSFFNTALPALIPNLVPREKLGNAVAFSSGAHQVAMICGPALGGILYAVDGSLAFIAATVFWFLAGGATFIMNYRAPPAQSAPKTSVEALAAGFAFTSSRPVVLGALLLDAIAAFLTNLIVILPIFAKDILQVGPEGLGALRSAPAVGALAVAWWISRSNYVQYRAGPRFLTTVAVFALATTVFGFSENFLLSMVALAVVGGSNMVSVVIRHTLVQVDTPDELRGRVASVNSLYAIASGELGQVRAGVMAGFLGPVASVVIGGIGAFALVLVWPLIFPELYRRDRLVEQEDKAPEAAKPG